MSTLRSKNRKPVHPGAILREDVLPSLNITQTELADRLGVSRRSISQILHEHRPLTPDMAIRLAHFLGNTPESWLNMQQALDVWKLKRKNACIYEQIEKVA
ncbi:MAG: addiction module antidote protein, HigA family [Gammaproteobacteria bacterium RIFCSPHIGHO2_12_FULL_37_34]|nr:MAG: addiction module antidote protein, HigA family [Gammaproteobacteria bacterium RIFCSPHIGHO2_12_FULL_37_34]